MKLFERSLNLISTSKQKKLSGGVNSIPFGFNALDQYIPGMQRQNYVIITANSGVGKTKLTKNLYVYRPFRFVTSRPELKIRLKILYFCLEEPDVSFLLSAISNTMFEFYGERLSIKDLKSISDPLNPAKVISDLNELRIKRLQNYFEAFEESIEVITDVFSPFEIYQRAISEMEKYGDYSIRFVPVYNPETKETEVREFKDRFILDDDVYFQIVVDHVSLITPEKGESLHNAMRFFSSHYLVNLKNLYGASVCLVQQQGAETERKVFTSSGANVESKLEPSLNGLGDCKLTQRDADEVIGLFAPARHDILAYRNYDVTKFGDHLRVLSVLKARDGVPNTRFGFFFDGATNFFAEIPSGKNMTPADYDKVTKFINKYKNA